MSTLRWRSTAALVLTACVCLAGCGGPAATPPPATGTVTATSSPSATTASVTARPASALQLDAVDFLNAQIGWLAGHRGSSAAILRTLDGGASWERVPAGGGAFLHLDFVDPDHGWALARTGADVQIERTADGGATWAVQWAGPVADAQYLKSAADAQIAMLSLQRGFAVFGGMLLATVDGGSAWHPVALPAGFTPTSMSWRNAQSGWVAGMACPPGGGACHAAVLQTVHGGAGWAATFTSAEAAVPVAGGAGLPGISFPTAAAGWLYFKTPSLQGRLYATTDGGATWTLQQADLAGGHGVAGSPVFADPTTGWLPLDGGAAAAPGGLEVTRDGGLSWTRVGAARGWSIRAVSLVSAKVGWAIGGPAAGPATASFLVATADGGATWSENPLTLRPMAAVDFVSASLGFGAGSAASPGAVLASADGGATWSVRALLAGSVTAVSFISPEQGWALEQPWPPGQGLLDVMATTDGGKIWTEVGQLAGSSLPPPDYLRFFDGQRGLLMTGQPAAWRVLTTADGGATWTRSGGRPMPQQQPFVAAMPTPETLLMLKQGPALDRSVDGGATWRTVPGLPQGHGGGIGLGASSGTDLWLFLQRAAEPARRTTLAHSTNGGRTWTLLALPAGMPLGRPLAVAALSSRDAWVLSGGALFATRDGGRAWTWLR